MRRAWFTLPDTLESRPLSPRQVVADALFSLLYILPIQGAVWWWWPTWTVEVAIARFWCMWLGTHASVLALHGFLTRYFGGDALAALQALERYFAPRR